MDSKTPALAALDDASLLRQQGLINGEWVGGESRFGVTDPATGQLLAEVANLGAAEAGAAINAAQAAWPMWRSKTAKERAAILMRWYQLMLRHADDLARIMTAEQGKPLAEARGEVVYGASFLEWFAEEGKRVYGETIPTTDNNKRYLVIKQSMGVCAAITPWKTRRRLWVMLPLAMTSTSRSVHGARASPRAQSSSGRACGEKHSGRTGMSASGTM